MNACTIVAKNYLAHARVLGKSLREHHPASRLTVLVLDELDGHFTPEDEPFDVVTPAEIDLPEFKLMAGAYDVLELSTAVKPWLLRSLLRKSDHVIYLDPDIQIFSPLDDVSDLARKHGMVLTPHNVAAMPRDGKKPSETDILVAGAYNLGFIALGHGDASEEFIAWWSERLLTDCIVDIDRGYFVDQRWIDLVPGMVPSVHLLRDPGYNVAYWNLHTRAVERSDGSLCVNGSPLRFFHFSGYDPNRPDLLSKHQNRIQLGERDTVRELCDAYGAALKAEGYDTTTNWPYSYDRAASGLRLSRMVRRMYADAVRENAVEHPVFEPEGERQLVEYATAPVGDGADLRITRFMATVHASRPDLQAAFPVLTGESAEGLLNWFDEYAPEALGDAMMLVGTPTGEGARFSHTDPVEMPPFGVNVIGYMTSELGVGEISRQVINALDTQDLPLLPVGLVATASRQGHAYGHRTELSSPFPLNVMCVNADQTPGLAADAGHGLIDDDHITVGWWWWEVDNFPEVMREGFRHVDELWAGSRFVAETLSPIAPVPVLYMPTPVSLPPAVEPDRAAFGVDPDAFLYLFAFDHNSVFERKNPLGAIEAFTRAFPEPRDDVVLVLKSINGDRHRPAHERLVAAAAGRDDIMVVDRYVSAAQKDGLIAACDCYVSLHRSEGFGITMAEALLLGKPVVATDYGGNTDFVTERTAFPVDVELVPIGAGNAPYPPEGTWAEPDVEHAGRLLREVFDDPAEARLRAERGAALIRARHSPEATGRAMTDRLKVLHEQLGMRRAPRAAAERAREKAFDSVRRGPLPSGRSRRSPQRLARGLLLRAMRPLLEYQREINHDLYRAIERTAEGAERHTDLTRAELEAAALRRERRDANTLRALRRDVREAQQLPDGEPADTLGGSA